MKTIRFFVCNDGVIRTTATEIGNWLLAKQANIKPLKDGFYHFGTQFNSKLCTTINQLNRSGAGTDALLSTSDFMKLDDVNNNKEIIEYLISNHMCDVASVKTTKKGIATRSLDTYTLSAVKAIAINYGLTISEEDIDKEIKCFMITPILSSTKRKETTNHSTSAMYAVSLI